MPHDEPASNAPEAAPPKPSFFQAIKAVAWAFFGVRKSSGREADAKIPPLYFALAALIGLAMFVGLVMLAAKAAAGA